MEKIRFFHLNKSLIWTLEVLSQIGIIRFVLDLVGYKQANFIKLPSSGMKCEGFVLSFTINNIIINISWNRMFNLAESKNIK